MLIINVNSPGVPRKRELFIAATIDNIAAMSYRQVARLRVIKFDEQLVAGPR